MRRKRKVGMPAALEADLRREVVRMRRAEVQDAVETVRHCAQVYLDELGRDDNAHRGRLERRRGELEGAVDRCQKALRPGPITEDDLDWARRSIALDQEQVAKAKRKAKRRAPLEP